MIVNSLSGNHKEASLVLDVGDGLYRFLSLENSTREIVWSFIDDSLKTVPGIIDQIFKLSNSQYYLGSVCPGYQGAYFFKSSFEKPGPACGKEFSGSILCLSLTTRERLLGIKEALVAAVELYKKGATKDLLRIFFATTVLKKFDTPIIYFNDKFFENFRAIYSSSLRVLLSENENPRDFEWELERFQELMIKCSQAVGDERIKEICEFVRS